MQKLEAKAQYIRKQTLEMIAKAGKGHIGSSLSCVDILVALYYEVLRPEDKFILSKGHACAPLYAILADKGYFPEEELWRFNKENALLEGHPNINIPGIHATTGSLGNGLGMGAGMAMTQTGRVFVLMGDGECQEGSVWEAAVFALTHKLTNLIAIIDHNGLSATDKLGDDNLVVNWWSLGWLVKQRDGHSIEEILSAFLSYPPSNKPKAIIFETIKGKGISFMENKIEWHNKVPDGEQLEQARRELGY